MLEKFKEILKGDSSAIAENRRIELERMTQLSVKVFEAAGFNLRDKVKVRGEDGWQITALTLDTYNGRNVPLAKVMSQNGKFETVTLFDLCDWNPTPEAQEEATEASKIPAAGDKV
ncbi:MAG: hypothetical protein V1763_01700 [Parcubacteria group bacterium]